MIISLCFFSIFKNHTNNQSFIITINCARFTTVWWLVRFVQKAACPACQSRFSMRPPNLKNAALAVRAQSTLDLIQVIASKYNLNTFKTLSFYYLASILETLFNWGFESNLCKCSLISWWCNTCTMVVVIHLRWTITMYWSWWQLQTSSSWMVYCASVKLNVLIWWISIT